MTNRTPPLSLPPLGGDRRGGRDDRDEVVVQGVVEKGLVVVDVEGNGRQPPEIVEIALLDLRPTVPVSVEDIRSWMVRPAQPITRLVTSKVHGISNAAVAAAPTWREVAADVVSMLAGRVLVAHNAVVERRVLAGHLPSFAPPLVVDTLRLARTVWPDLPGGYSLDNLIARLDLPDPHLGSRAPRANPTAPGALVRHRAGYDAWMTAAVLIELISSADLDAKALLTAAAVPRPPAGGPRTTSTPDQPEKGLW